MKFPDKDFAMMSGNKFNHSLHLQGFTTRFYLASFRWLMVNRNEWMMIDFAEGDIFTYRYYNQDEFDKDLKEMSEWWNAYLKENE